jgi:phosphoglycerate kinase
LVLPLSQGAAALQRAAGSNVVLLENIRFERGEDENSPALARELGRLGQLYVNEAFSVSHRTAASVVGITRHLKSYAGFGLAAEVEALERVRKIGKKPVVAVVGGAKVADKLPVIAKLLPRLSAVLVGGAVANTFLAAKGYNVGASLIDKAVLKEAKSLLRQAGKKIVLPVDVVVDSPRAPRHEGRWKLADEVATRERIVDVGTRTTILFSSYLKQASTILWAGPLGLVEQPNFSHGTLSLARLVSARAHGPAFVLVGGGDTVNFFHHHKLWVDHVSLAGSAMLDQLAGVKLPGLRALER